ncbi:hypothetical protein [Bdellovibrio bacteriovorus]|uniref:hypothetical protein n=1 Tax=Bdellovibrio bacteriovorus TaxID=959 RepID=UPI0035A89101
MKMFFFLRHFREASLLTISLLSTLVSEGASAQTSSGSFVLKYVRPSGVLTSSLSATLYLQTPGNATCKYSRSDESFARMKSVFRTTGAQIHGHGLTGLTAGTPYTYYIACQNNVTKAVATETVQFTTAQIRLPAQDLIGLAQLGAEAYLPSPATNYGSLRSCALYKFYDTGPGYYSYVTENFSKEATASVAACKSFIEKYYLSHAACGSADVDNKYWSVVGVLKNVADGTLKFNTAGGLHNISVAQGSSVIAMNAAKCATEDDYAKGKGVLWGRVEKCDYAKTGLCVKPHVPLLSQSAPQLATYIASATGNSNIKRDAGWCGAVSLTMSTLGAVHSSQGETLQDLFLWKSKLPSLEDGSAIADLNARTSFYSDVIYQVGNLAKTNWASGGTQTDKALYNLFSHIDPSIGNLNKAKYQGEVISKKFQVLTNEWNAESLVKGLTVGQNNNFARGSAIIRDCYPQKVVKVRSDEARDYWESSDYKCTWKKSGMTHALSVNGLEEDYVKIYDPWGKVYNLEVIENTEVPTLNMKIALAIPVGSSGYFRDSGLLSDSLEGYVQKAVTAKGAPAPVGRRAINYFYIAIYGYQTGIVGKLKGK